MDTDVSPAIVTARIVLALDAVCDCALELRPILNAGEAAPTGSAIRAVALSSADS